MLFTLAKTTMRSTPAVCARADHRLPMVIRTTARRPRKPMLAIIDNAFNRRAAQAFGATASRAGTDPSCAHDWRSLAPVLLAIGRSSPMRLQSASMIEGDERSKLRGSEETPPRRCRSCAPPYLAETRR